MTYYKFKGIEPLTYGQALNNYMHKATGEEWKFKRNHHFGRWDYSPVEEPEWAFRVDDGWFYPRNKDWDGHVAVGNNPNCFMRYSIADDGKRIHAEYARYLNTKKEAQEEEPSDDKKAKDVPATRYQFDGYEPETFGEALAAWIQSETSREWSFKRDHANSCWLIKLEEGSRWFYTIKGSWYVVGQRSWARHVVGGRNPNDAMWTTISAGAKDIYNKYSSWCSGNPQWDGRQPEPGGIEKPKEPEYPDNAVLIDGKPVDWAVAEWDVSQLHKDNPETEYTKKLSRDFRTREVVAACARVKAAFREFPVCAQCGQHKAPVDGACFLVWECINEECGK